MEPKAVDALRRWTVPLIVVFALLMVFGMAMPLAAFALSSGGLQSVRDRFVEGGAFMYLLVLVLVFCACLVGVLGALLIRGIKVPGAALLASIGLPLAVGVAGTSLGIVQVTHALAAVTSEMRGMILVMGLSEAWADTSLGLLVAAHVAFSIGLAAFFAHAALAPGKFSAEAPASSSGAGPALLCGGIGVAALAASVALRFVLRAHPGFIDLFAWAGLFLAAICAALSAPALKALHRLADAELQSQLWRRAALTAIAFAAGLGLLGYAGWTIERASLFHAIGHVDPVMRARILADGASDLATRPIVTLADASLGLLVLLVPLLLAGPAIERGLKGVRVSFVVSVVGLIACAAIALVPLQTTHRLLDDMRRPMGRLASIPGLELPTVKEPKQVFSYGRAIFMPSRERVLFGDREGTAAPVAFQPELLRPTGQYARADDEVTVAASRGVAFADLAAVLEPVAATGASRFRLVVAPEKPAPRPPLGDLEAIAGPALWTVSFRFEPSADHKHANSKLGAKVALGASSTLVVFVEGDRAHLSLLDGEGVSAEIALTREDCAKALKEIRSTLPEVSTILIAPAPTDDVARVVALLELFTEPHRAGEKPLDLALTADRARLPRNIDPKLLR